MSKKKYVSNEISKLHNVDEIENLVKSMKNYIANDYTGDDSITDESAAFTENAFDLLNAVTYLMYRSVDRCRSGLIRRWFGHRFVECPHSVVHDKC